MPLEGSPFTSVPPGIGRPATPPDPRMAALLAASGSAGGASPGSMPGAPGPQGEPFADGPNGEPDLFQRVAMMILDPKTKQINPALVLIFAGMGLREALEKSGKYVSKPHRSNEELASRGMDVGTPGQTGMPSPAQLTPSMPISPPKMPGF